MKQNRFAGEQIVGIVKDHETGPLVSTLCRKHGVSDAGISTWEAGSGSIDVSGAKRLKTP